MWYWNCYPGARVDSDAPLYQLFDKEMWDDFSFTERYPARDELTRYFDHIDDKIHFSEHTEYNKRVEGAKFDEGENKWTIVCKDGAKAKARWFIPAIGFAAKPYVPKYKGAENFKGQMHHTAVSHPSTVVNGRTDVYRNGPRKESTSPASASPSWARAHRAFRSCKSARNRPSS